MGILANNPLLHLLLLLLLLEHAPADRRTTHRGSWAHPLADTLMEASTS